MAVSGVAGNQTQTKRVLALFDELRRDRSTQRAAAIDAQFYWRCCRLDFVAAVEPLRQHYEQVSEDLRIKCDAALGMLAGAEEPASPVDPQTDLPHGLAKWEAVWERMTRLMDAADALSLAAKGHDETARAAAARLAAAAGSVKSAFAVATQWRETVAFPFPPPRDTDQEPAPRGGRRLSPFARRVLAVSQEFRLPYHAVLGHVTGESDIIGPVAFDLIASGGGTDVSVQLDVYSSEVSGQFVEGSLWGYSLGYEAATRERTHRLGTEPGDHPGFRPREAGEVSIRMSFELKTDRSSNQPFVRITSALPFPPRGVLANAYEAVVVGGEGWAGVLPGPANNQQPETALRTWAVGLLAAAGWDTNDAIRAVTERAGWDNYVSQERFNQDRRLLVERFPAARAHLFRRRRPPPAP